MKTITLKGETFKHGDRITCEIQGKYIEDARLFIKEDFYLYIYQNFIGTSRVVELFDYKYSWWFIKQIYDRNCSTVKNIKKVDEKPNKPTHTNIQEWSDGVVIKEGEIKLEGVTYTPEELREEIKRLRRAEERYRKFINNK